MPTELDNTVQLAKLAERLTTLREKHGYSEQFVADHLGVSQQAYRKYEHGGGVTAERIFKLCELYGCSADYIFGLVDDEAEILAESTLPKDEIGLLVLWRRAKTLTDKKRLLYALGLSGDADQILGIESGE